MNLLQRLINMDNQDPAIVPAGPSNQDNYGAAADLAQKII